MKLPKFLRDWLAPMVVEKPCEHQWGEKYQDMTTSEPRIWIKKCKLCPQIRQVRNYTRRPRKEKVAE